MRIYIIIFLLALIAYGQSAQVAMAVEYADFPYVQLTPEQEERMLNLIARLEDKKITFWDKGSIAASLGNYAAPRSVAILKKLIADNEVKIEAGDEVFAIKNVAKGSLDKIKASKDIEKLESETTPLQEKIGIIRKYKTPGMGNRYAEPIIKKYVITQADVNPGVYVPLMVEIYPGGRATEKVARQYSDLADEGIVSSLESTYEVQVRSIVGLIRNLRKEKFIDQIYKIAFEKDGNIDYSKDLSSLRGEARFAFSFFGSKGVECLKKALYSEYDDKDKLISVLANMNSSESAKVIKEYSLYYKRQGTEDAEISNTLHWALKKIDVE